MILDWMFAQKTPTLDGHWPDFNHADIEVKFALSPADYAVLINDLGRMQVILGRRPLIAFDTVAEAAMADFQMDKVVDYLNERVQYEMITFTTLGVHFMAACTPPKSRE